MSWQTHSCASEAFGCSPSEVNHQEALKVQTKHFSPSWEYSLVLSGSLFMRKNQSSCLLCLHDCKVFIANLDSSNNEVGIQFLFCFSLIKHHSVNHSLLDCDCDCVRELRSHFKGNWWINNTMVFSSRLWFHVIVWHVCQAKEKGVWAGIGCFCR